jgi:hypothetical protein
MIYSFLLHELISMILECARTEKRMKPSQVFCSLELLSALTLNVTARIKTENENIFQIIFALTYP